MIANAAAPPAAATMTPPRAGPKLRAMLKLTLLSVMAAGSVNAQWVVTDPGHTIQNVVQQILVSGERAGEFVKELDEWKKQYEHFQQQLIKFQSFLNNPIALPNSLPLKAPASE